MKHHTLKKAVLLSAIVAGALLFPTSHAKAASDIDVWWPAETVKVTGTQPFKALLRDQEINSYSMSWRVDNGQENPMETNYSDYPHKEASVDLAGWTWRGSDVYTVTFTAKDSAGKTLSEKAIHFYANYASQKTENHQAQAAVAAPKVSDAVVQAAPSTTAAPAPVQAAPAVDITVSPVTITESVISPADQANITGPGHWSARILELPATKYKMFWQVDNGQWNEMTNSVDNSFKDALVDASNWSWKGYGPYAISFIAQDLRGKEIARKSVSITSRKPAATSAQTSPAPHAVSDSNSDTSKTLTPAPSAAAQTPEVAIQKAAKGANPLGSAAFYRNPQSNARAQAKEWQNSHPENSALMEKIAANPEAKWIGNWNSNVLEDTKAYVSAAAALSEVPVLIAYNIPSRDCGSYSAGGADNASSYKKWISDVAKGIGERKAVVIVEPDALAGISCLDQAGQASRLALLNFAVDTLGAHKNTVVYLDAGNSNWVGAEDMAKRLQSAGVTRADGFALNVSNYNSTTNEVAFGTRLSGILGGTHFVVDTSRNGQGPQGSEWCNPQGRGLGKPATTNTGNPLVDAYMWLKNPGESDGTCNGGPSAGVWWPEYALGLAKRAEF